MVRVEQPYWLRPAFYISRYDSNGEGPTESVDVHPAEVAMLVESMLQYMTPEQRADLLRRVGGDRASEEP